MRGAARLRWDEAIATVAGEFRRVIDSTVRNRWRFYVSGQLLTEDYYVANKLMKGYIGAANIDTNSRLCMASAVAGHKRAFGEDVVPVSYDDLDAGRSGRAGRLEHRVVPSDPVAAADRGARSSRPQLKIVVIDPRRTATTQLADLHLPLAAGTDVRLFNGLLVWLEEHGRVDRAFVDAHTRGWEEALATARARRQDHSQRPRGRADSTCELLREFFEMFARHRP